MVKLKEFVVLKKLSVKNICIEKKQVKASYEIEKGDGKISSYEFIYTYQDSYFEKTSANDVNLASVMLTQVAINYGLFFEMIEFDGLFDSTDKRFIVDAIENTSKEIITNKLLIDNQFLKSPYNKLEVSTQKKYTQAKIIFTNKIFGNLKVEKKEMLTDFNKYAILSSGGKDSLLTYGIIKEIGEPYPVFINEAGRHWFTAVNAYRYYKETESNTEKPWCNSDRVFNWMLKQLPFIKENYANVRADIYPIRLWTVAVFLFGVLPIVRKKGIGNILIGDEYDTTIKGITNGISHYNGLYDQSKYFDNSLTKYYQKKGWGIYQYSILRSLSELLIMKILLKRYPELQIHQVSCHAAHEMNGRMFPCGNCEKCRRIIGMIKALDEDPEKCGYTIKQIEKGLKALENLSVKQFCNDASHLYYLLLKKELIKPTELTKKLARKHTEITKLRFDEERSNIDDIPEHIRIKLFSLLIKYADGAVKLKNKKWEDFIINQELLNFLNNEN